MIQFPVQGIYKNIQQWDDMTFEENPYGKAIPDIFLDNISLMREIDYKGNRIKIKSLREIKQDGFAINKIKNDKDKLSDAERNDYVMLSKIFHELYSENKLCPSNYVSKVLYALRDVDKINHLHLPIEVYNGYLTRSLRAYASFIRELVLEEEIKQFLEFYAKEHNTTYSMLQTTWENDVHDKTDIMFQYDGKIYRVWSYQTTNIGQYKTGNRILKKCGKGYNLLLPSNFKEMDKYSGWLLYNKHIVNQQLEHLLNTNPISYEEMKSKIIKTDFKAVSEPQIFVA